MTRSNDRRVAVLDSFTPVDLSTVSTAAWVCTMMGFMMGLFAEHHNLDITGMTVQICQIVKSTTPYRFGRNERSCSRCPTAGSQTRSRSSSNTLPVPPRYTAIFPDIEKVSTINCGAHPLRAH